MISDHRLIALSDWIGTLAAAARKDGHRAPAEAFTDVRELLLELAGDRAALEYMRQFERKLKEVKQ